MKMQELFEGASPVNRFSMDGPDVIQHGTRWYVTGDPSVTLQFSSNFAKYVV